MSCHTDDTQSLVEVPKVPSTSLSAPSLVALPQDPHDVSPSRSFSLLSDAVDVEEKRSEVHRLHGSEHFSATDDWKLVSNKELETEP